jgi:hypothetical protein
LPSWSRDGNAVYFTSKRSGRFEVWRAAAHAGSEEQITRNGGYIAFESTDRKRLYYTLSDSGAEGLYAKSLPDGAEVQVINENVVARGFVVFSDGVYYLHWVAGDTFEIRFHEFLSGRDQVIRKIEARLDGASGLAVSPDRQTFLYSIVVRPESDLMLIENFR